MLDKIIHYTVPFILLAGTAWAWWWQWKNFGLRAWRPRRNRKANDQD